MVSDEPYRYREGGFTLIELMISLALGLMIISGVMNVLYTSKYTEMTMASVSEVDQKGRLALDLLTRNIRMAGYQGCADPESVKPYVVAEGVNVTDLYQRSIEGWRVVSETNWKSDQKSEPVPSEADHAEIGGDVIRLKHASSRGVPLDKSMDSVSDRVVVKKGPIQFDEGSLAIISDCDKSAIFRVTGVKDSGENDTLEIQHGKKKGGNTTPALNHEYAKGENSRLMLFRDFTYFVGRTDRVDDRGDPIMALYRLAAGAEEPEEIIEGIESFQVRYGERVDKAIAFKRAEESIDWENLKVIKISLLVSGGTVLTEDNNRSYDLLGTTLTPDDSGDAQYASRRRFMKTFTTSISVFNKLD